MLKHHTKGKHEYLFNNRIFNSDFVINLPKMKTHIKTGFTGCLKNLVGTAGYKEYLPHYIKGSYFEGGDCYFNSSIFLKSHDKKKDLLWENFSDLSISNRKVQLMKLKMLRILARINNRDFSSSGSWSGNDTLWRTVLDINHIIYFHEKSPKKIISIVDGIVAGQGKGPLKPTPKYTGLLIGGENPAYIDAVIGMLMGYNISRIPLVYNALYHKKSKFGGQNLEDFFVNFVDIKNNNIKYEYFNLPNLHFEKPKYWERANKIIE
jgi:hypothetical protein